MQGAAEAAALRAEARDAISKLIYGYAEAIDGGDFERIARMFAHAVIRSDGGEFRGVDEVRAMYRRFTTLYDSAGRKCGPEVRGATPRTRHVTTNLMIDLSDDLRSAGARCYFTVFQAIPGTIELQPIVRGAYRDAFECADGAWRFSERVMITDGVGNIAHHLNENPF
jgi:3-phenylpropionate/cinnamic acid dioxygenase small subunit